MLQYLKLLFIFLSAVDSDDDDEDDEDESLSRGLFEKKKKSQKCSKNKSGRKAKWSQSLLGDLVDIVISNDRVCKFS